jgi:hypothetical protein
VCALVSMLRPGAMLSSPYLTRTNVDRPGGGDEFSQARPPAQHNPRILLLFLFEIAPVCSYNADVLHVIKVLSAQMAVTRAATLRLASPSPC